MNPTNELALASATPLPVAASEPRPLTIEAAFNAALGGQISKESLEVAKGLLALDWQHKFNRAWFELRKHIGTLDLYADKQVTDNSGNVLFAYCSEREMCEKLEPILLAHGFTMLSGQELKDGIITVSITFIHEAGHQETRCFSVRSPAQNRVMNDASKCDAGGSTSAWRNLIIKCLGLKARIQVEDDPRNLGEQITPEQAEELQRRVMETESNELAFLKLAGVTAIAGKPTLEHYKAIMSEKYQMLDELLRKKESRGR